MDPKREEQSRVADVLLNVVESGLPVGLEENASHLPSEENPAASLLFREHPSGATAVLPHLNLSLNQPD